MNNNLEKIVQELEKDQDLDYSSLKIKYLGKNGLLTSAAQEIRNLPNEEKAEYGRSINHIKEKIQAILQQKESTNQILTNSRIDVTAPFDTNNTTTPTIWDNQGSRHPLHKEVEILVGIFQKMGFDVMESRQIDDDYHMFESLNFPVGHPARDMYDTFWTEDGLVLPAHTSTMQNRAMKHFGPPPIRAVLPGRCFRNEATDAGHEHTFYQIEGVYVDKGISLANMEATIKSFLESYLETDLEIKMQPSYFPFTVPGCEFVISCPFCNKAGCTTCGHSGWIELMGCGMIHPEVLKQADIDPEIYSGFAWGFGADRLTMIKRGITDIRYLRDSDLNFLQQF